MYKSSDVADRLRSMAKIRGITMKDALKDAGLSFNLMTNMRKSMPNATSLAKLADRLECSVDYLLGRTEEILTPRSGQAPVELPPSPTALKEEPPQQVPASRNVSEMLDLFSQLPDREQVLLIGRLQHMVEQLQAREEGQGGISESSPSKAG